MDLTLEQRVAIWIKTRLGVPNACRSERAIRLLEEAVELAQAEGITQDQAVRQVEYVYRRPPGDSQQEAGGVAVCLLGWCAATGNRMIDVATREVERIEAKPASEIRGSLARKTDQDLVVAINNATPDQIASAMERCSTDALEFGVRFEAAAHQPFRYDLDDPKERAK